MFNFYQNPKSGDPSNLRQEFVPVNMSVLCCRYWWLHRWKCTQMSFPYWRLYWNKTAGAYVYNEKRINLGPDCLILIPPHTKFSTDIESIAPMPDLAKFELVGSRVKNMDEENVCLKENKILHLFIHFNLGGQLDNVSNEIFSFKINKDQEMLIGNIVNNLLTGTELFDVHISIKVYQLILSAVNQIPKNKFISRKMDVRMVSILEFINRGLGGKLTNNSLAGEVNMATNSFTRFFKDQVKMSPQDYIRKERIAKACHLLDHSTHTIDEISEVCGFSDRFHFSKMFKKMKAVSPAEYKKKFTLSED
ncbi:MAG: AraC family transcriptional regulator [Salinivirgaceae bacterium]|jgi:AraC-like DNA-binding protein